MHAGMMHVNVWMKQKMNEGDRGVPSDVPQRPQVIGQPSPGLQKN
jgi:hypothetical protein